MKNFIALITLGASCLFTSACTTVQTPQGPKQVLSPGGAAIVQGLVATGVGVGTGALMKNQPSWMTGGASGLAGNVSSQFVNSFIPQAGGGNQYYQGQQPAPQPAPVNYRQASTNPYYAQDQAYAQGYNQPPTEPVYRRLANGQFVQVN